jgi:subfamily B ATP-binding cassette protein HlyB/CyaB
MSTGTDSARSADPGLEALVTLLHLQGAAADATDPAPAGNTDQRSGDAPLRHDLGPGGLPNRLVTAYQTPLPPSRPCDGGFLVIAKASENKATGTGFLFSRCWRPRPIFDDAG